MQIESYNSAMHLEKHQTFGNITGEIEETKKRYKVADS